MTHLFAIVVLVSLHLAGAWAGGLLPQAVPWWARAAMTIAPFAVLAVIGSLGTAWCARRMDRRGDGGAIRTSHRLLSLLRAIALLWHLASVFILGWLGAVRSLTGDLVLVDELIASAPAFALLLWTFRLAHPIERRVRAAVLMREIDAGLPVYPFPAPWAYVLGAARNNLAIMALPLVLILGWAELLDRAVSAFNLAETWGESAVYTIPGIQIAGALIIFALIPPLMVRVWDTTPIPPGELRDGLERMARQHAVRVRNFLIWRTSGAMLNGAVIGLTPWLRYIVLTDALLDHLPEPEVEAVAAHEIAHVRKRHMIWLALAVLGSAMLLGEAATIAARWWSLGDLTATWVGALGTLAGVLVVLGLVSRRFEWQADAFAARHLSGPAGPVITHEAATAMSDALARVSALNGMPQDRFTWRHGSITTRRQRLGELVGQPTNRLGIDRHVRRLLWFTVAMFAAGLCLVAAGMLGMGPYAQS